MSCKKYSCHNLSLIFNQTLFNALGFIAKRKKKSEAGKMTEKVIDIVGTVSNAVDGVDQL